MEVGGHSCLGNPSSNNSGPCTIMKMTLSAYPKTTGKAIANYTLKTPKYHTERHAQHNQGECKPPSRQVSSPDFTKSELVDKHCTANNTATSTDSNANLVGEHQPGKRRGRRSREKAEKNKRHAQQGSGFWEVVWTIGDSEAMGDGDMQPEVEVGGDKSLFMRQTNLFKPE